MLKNKNIILGVSGGIACFKAVSLASSLVKNNASVHVIMTKNATEFVTPLTFEAITGNDVHLDTFEKRNARDINHISLADKADLVVIAPATANVIAKFAHGLADDMLSTVVLACDTPKILCPAMNTKMYENQVTQDNINILKKYAWDILEGESGRLACGAVGKGRMAEADIILEKIIDKASMQKDLSGLNILITAGATREELDPVRFITNHSTGKMGYALAKIASCRGANVSLISANTSIKAPSFVKNTKINSTSELFEEVKKQSQNQDVIIMCAAVSDYSPAEISNSKIKKNDENLSMELKKNVDILMYLGKNKAEKQILCGFAMETENLINNAKSKLDKKNLDMIVANSLNDKGSGFATDTNLVTIIKKSEQKSLPLLSKDEVAIKILDEILNLI